MVNSRVHGSSSCPSSYARVSFVRPRQIVPTEITFLSLITSQNDSLKRDECHSGSILNTREEHDVRATDAQLCI